MLRSDSTALHLYYIENKSENSFIEIYQSLMQRIRISVACPLGARPCRVAPISRSKGRSEKRRPTKIIPASTYHSVKDGEERSKILFHFHA